MALPGNHRTQKFVPFIEAAFVVFLGGFIVYLLINNYQAQVRLRSSAAEYYLQHVREQAPLGRVELYLRGGRHHATT